METKTEVPQRDELQDLADKLHEAKEQGGGMVMLTLADTWRLVALSRGLEIAHLGRKLGNARRLNKDRAARLREAETIIDALMDRGTDVSKVIQKAAVYRMDFPKRGRS